MQQNFLIWWKYEYICTLQYSDGYPLLHTDGSSRFGHVCMYRRVYLKCQNETEQNLSISWEFPITLVESKLSSRGSSEGVKHLCQPIKNVWSAAVWNWNPTWGSPWLLVEPEQMSWRGSKVNYHFVVTCQSSCLSSVGSPTTEHKPKMAQPLMESKWNILYSTLRDLEAGRGWEGTELRAQSCTTTLQPLPPFTSTTTPRSKS